MKYLVPLWGWKRGYCQCEESLILLHFNPVYINREEIPWISRILARLLNRRCHNG